jgi:hypothetical protein
MWRGSLKLTFATSLYLRRASFFSSSAVMMINPYSENHGVYGGGAVIVTSDEVGRAAPPYVLEIR